mgnify:CR=1 FL=1
MPPGCGNQYDRPAIVLWHCPQPIPRCGPAVTTKQPSVFFPTSGQRCLYHIHSYHFLPADGGVVAKAMAEGVRAKFGTDYKARHAYRKECKGHYKIYASKKHHWFKKAS